MAGAEWSAPFFFGSIMERKGLVVWLPPGVVWVALYAGHRWGLSALPASVAMLQLSHGLGFALFGVLLMGALARRSATVQLPLWRLYTVVVGAAAAALEVGLLGLPGVLFLPLWAAALIGVSAASLAARLLPRRLLGIWLNREKLE